MSIAFQHRLVNNRLFDFNHYGQVEKDRDGMLEAVKAFFIDDPYWVLRTVCSNGFSLPLRSLWKRLT